MDWLNVGNDKGGMRYSTLKQIDRNNVQQLKVAWTYSSGDASPGSTIECTPVVADGVMYVTTPSLKFGGYTYFNDQSGYPANKPPWGSLTAIDVSKGEFAWQVPIGEFPALKAKGVPPTGTENFGGTIVTAGGLVFVGGTKDEMFHAYDKATGKLLWEVKLPNGGYATPSTYMVNGRQYVAIAAGGGGKLRTPSGDTYQVFALPDVTPAAAR